MFLNASIQYFSLLHVLFNILTNILDTRSNMARYSFPHIAWATECIRIGGGGGDFPHMAWATKFIKMWGGMGQADIQPQTAEKVNGPNVLNHCRSQGRGFWSSKISFSPPPPPVIFY